MTQCIKVFAIKLSSIHRAHNSGKSEPIHVGCPLTMHMCASVACVHPYTNKVYHNQTGQVIGKIKTKPNISWPILTTMYLKGGANPFCWLLCIIMECYFLLFHVFSFFKFSINNWNLSQKTKVNCLRQFPLSFKVIITPALRSVPRFK